jgi:hypothetical protein
MTSALPNVARYLCVDAVPASTFICEYYLRYRQAARAQTVPLTQIEDALKSQRIDLAINIHSFSECSLDAVEWWVRLLASHRVPHVMIVPDGRDMDCSQLAGGILPFVRESRGVWDFAPVLRRHGYRIVAKGRKYRDPIVQKYGISPANHFLFRLTDVSS